jgi:hypothetical protein
MVSAIGSTVLRSADVLAHWRRVQSEDGTRIVVREDFDIVANFGGRGPKQPLHDQLSGTPRAGIAATE